MGRINRLDKSVYNRISAGEVVENPASVVKELVENAIDAGATDITVSIEYGGIKKITVADNGCGMDEEDLELSILPHATSKIFLAEDLETVSTLGFRGEALASISAVSKMKISSRYIENEYACFIETESGEIVDKGRSNLQKGTTIEVSSLFYNTPARFRFLKTPKGEESAVTKLMGELIFANPDIYITYIVDDNTVYTSMGEGLKSAISTVFGAEINESMVSVHLSDNGYTVNGYCARAASSGIKGNRNNQVFIVNGRCISDATMQAVIANAYGNRLMKRTYPSVVLDIIIPFADVDVNVHPNKREVRFAEAKTVYGMVYNAIKTGLENDEQYQKDSLISMLKGDQSEEISIPQAPIKEESVETVDEDEEQKKAIQRQLMEGYYDNFPLMKDWEGPEKPAQQRSEGDSFFSVERIFDSHAVVQAPSEDNRPYEHPEQMLSWLNEAEDALSGGSVKYHFNDEENEEPSLKDEPYRVIGQLFNTYVLIEVRDVFILIDQHAAHERMLYDKFLRQIKTRVFVQELLLPIEVEATKPILRFFEKQKDNFLKLGFEMEFTKRSVVVRTVPTVLTGMNIALFLSDVGLDKDIEKITDMELFNEVLAQKACKSAIKGGDKMNNDQLEYFVNEYVKGDAPIQCPHGRPVFIMRTRRQIEKLFGRIV